MCTKKVSNAIRLLCAFILFENMLQAQPAHIMNAAELRLALEKLTVTGSVLYIGAHPDDENSALLAYFAKGKHLRTAYLSLTRGEGGQNLIGSEQGEQLGIIRTQELLNARRIDGAEQFFSRAIDFGYSKTSEETIAMWGRTEIVGDIVWILRKFRPDIVITRFSPKFGGHGNHTASAILAQEAFTLSGDSSQYPEQLRFVSPWKPKRLLFNHFRFGTDSSYKNAIPPLQVDVGEYDPLFGKSFTEFAGESRTMHKSQSMGTALNRGSAMNYFVVTAGDSSSKDIFEGIDLTWSRIPGSENIAAALKKALANFRDDTPSEILPDLLSAYHEMKALPFHPQVDEKKRELQRVVQSCLGLWIEATSSDYSYTPGSSFTVAATLVNRSSVPVSVVSIRFPWKSDDTLINAKLLNNAPLKIAGLVSIPPSAPFTQPYWLVNDPGKAIYSITDQTVLGVSESPSSVNSDVTMAIFDDTLNFTVPVLHRWIDPVDGEMYRSVQIIPKFSVSLKDKNIFVFDGDVRTVNVQVLAGESNIRGEAQLRVPPGWIVEPKSVPIALLRKNDDTTLSFSVRKSLKAISGTVSAEVVSGNDRYTSGAVSIQHSHIPPQMLLVKAEGKLLTFDLKKKGTRVGYIAGAGDEVPAALREIGYSVTLLTDDDLRSSELSKYDAIVAGVRAYNTRQVLRTVQSRLMSYVQNGGRYIVQYTIPQRGESDNIGPYPLTISRDRVTDEHSPVDFIDANDPVLNVPNKITKEDFKDWIQERGIYFAGTWDSHYAPVLAMQDPGEKPTEGSLLVCRYGKGYYIYTGLVFFRELPAGVQGAYRLFANMLSIGM